MKTAKQDPITPIREQDERFMRDALFDARLALEYGEFPVGCVIVYENQVIARGRRVNSMGKGIIELDHAEIVALRNLQASEPSVEMHRVTLYSTMEPCLMCYATILLTGIGRIVYAYEDAMGGSTGMSLEPLAPLYRSMKIDILPHVLRRESLALMQAFFRNPENGYWQGSLLERYTLEQE